MPRLVQLALGAMLAVAAFQSVRAIEEEEDVLVLDDENFDDAIKQYAPLLVEFYAPWCGHCKHLAPEYAKAAAALKPNGHRIAKVDATVARDLASRFNIQGFPTLKFFTSASAGTPPVDYNGGRDTDSIVNWVRRKSGPSTKPLKTASDATAFMAESEVGFIGLCEAGSVAEKVFNALAASMEDVAFGISSSAEVRTALGAEGTKATIVAVNKFAGQPNKVVMKGDAADADAVTDFVASNSLPLVIAFTQESAPRIFRGPVKTHFLLFADPESSDYASIIAEFRDVAASSSGKALFVTVDPSQDRVVKYFDVNNADMPTAILVSMPEGEQMKKFMMPKGSALSAESMKVFVKEYFSGGLKPFLKSAAVPADESTGPVTIVVGSSFERIALDTTKDVLLEFYAPWCGHCKQLAPDYDRLGAMFKDSGIDSVVIAKIDATENEVEYPGVSVKGFPTILFFPATEAGKAKRVVEYDGGRDADGFLQFLRKNTAKPFTLKGSDAEDDLEL